MCFDDITPKITKDEEEKVLANKYKVISKKGIINNNIIYEISILFNEWDFDRYIKNTIKRINSAKLNSKLILKN